MMFVAAALLLLLCSPSVVLGKEVPLPPQPSPIAAVAMTTITNAIPKPIGQPVPPAPTAAPNPLVPLCYVGSSCTSSNTINVTTVYPPNENYDCAIQTINCAANPTYCLQPCAGILSIMQPADPDYVTRLFDQTNTVNAQIPKANAVFTHCNTNLCNTPPTPFVPSIVGSSAASVPLQCFFGYQCGNTSVASLKRAGAGAGACLTTTSTVQSVNTYGCEVGKTIMVVTAGSNATASADVRAVVPNVSLQGQTLSSCTTDGCNYFPAPPKSSQNSASYQGYSLTTAALLLILSVAWTMSA